MLWSKELIENDRGPHWFAHDRIWEGLGLAWEAWHAAVYGVAKSQTRLND